jgi:GT2 family glycosyltransferase
MSTSVLIANYRAYTDLERCLNSLWPSLRADDEIIVVDNDTHLPRLAALARAHPFVATIPAGHTPKNHFGPEARRLELRLT